VLFPLLFAFDEQQAVDFFELSWRKAEYAYPHATDLGPTRRPTQRDQDGFPPARGVDPLKSAGIKWA
jgi:hypothetical protein